MFRIVALVVAIAILSSCDDASNPVQQNTTASLTAASDPQRDTVIHAVAALRAAPRSGRYLIVSDLADADAWVQIIYSDQEALFLDMTSLIRTAPQANALAVYEVVDGLVPIEGAIETVILTDDQVQLLRQTLMRLDLVPTETHLASKNEHNEWDGYQRSEQANLDALNDQQLADLILKILQSVHGIENVREIGIQINNSTP